MIDRFGWTAIRENDLIIGLQKGESNISLEPGGQFELSGAINKSVHDVEKEMNSFRWIHVVRIHLFYYVLYVCSEHYDQTTVREYRFHSALI